MNGFLSRLVVTETDNPREWELVEPLAYSSDSLGELEVHVGFVTDFASIPQPMWWLIAPSGRHTRAAVLHDWLYAHRPIVTRRRAGGTSRVTRSESDREFHRAMYATGVPRWRCLVMHVAVRLAGWLVWRRRSIKRIET